MKSFSRLFIIAIALLALGCAPGSDAPPLDLSTEVWRGHFKKGNTLTFFDVELKRDGDKVTGRYCWSEYSQNKNLRGKLTGEIKGNQLYLTPELPKGNKYSDAVLKLSMAECSAEEANEARNYVKQAKGLPADYMTKKLVKLYGPLTYKFNGNEESLNGFMAESHPRQWKPHENRDF